MYILHDTFYMEALDACSVLTLCSILPDLSWHKESCDWAALDLDVACLAWFLNAKAIWKHQLQKDPRQDHRSSDAKGFIHTLQLCNFHSQGFGVLKIFSVFIISFESRMSWHRSPSNLGAESRDIKMMELTVLLWQGSAPKSPCVWEFCKTVFWWDKVGTPRFVWCWILCPVRHSQIAM